MFETSKNNYVMMVLRPLLFILFCVAGLFLNAQNRFAFDYTSEYKLLMNGDSLKNAWAGGLNQPQFNTIDLNNDGIEDLIVFDRGGHKLMPFIKVSVNGSYKYRYAPQYKALFPKIEEWMLLIDYNCDGKKDLFCANPQGVSVYYNSGQLGSPAFSWALGTNAHLISKFGPNNFINLKVPTSDVPAIADLDGDGDVDILTFGQNGTIVEWHENTENCGLTFELNTECWGRFAENFNNNSVTINACPGSIKKTEHTNLNNKVLHSGSTMLLLDLDNNGRQDLLLGDVSFNDVTALFNTGFLDSAYISSQDSTFPSYNTPIDLPLFPALFYEDVTHDGIKDLLVAPNTVGSKNTNNVWLYKNLGTNTNPNFNRIDTAFLQSQMLDLGEGATPVLFDIDLDGRLDLIVGNDGKYTNQGTYESSLYYFKNVGTATTPKFELVTNDLGNLKQYNLGQGLSPTFGDLDGDFDIDMLVGAADGKLYYLENIGSLSNPNFVMTTPNFQGIDVGSYSAPQLFDVDGDFDLDLLIGEQEGNINYYVNNGTSPISFTLANSKFGGVNTGSYFAANGHSVPWMTMQNNKPVLFVGSTTRGILQYDSLTSVFSLPALINQNLGAGTLASANGNITPFGATKRNGRNQMLYTATELKAAGFVYGTVTKIGFNVLGNPTNILSQGFSIKLKNVSQTAIAAWDTGFTKVYDQLHAFYSGWNEFTLTTPFIWDGASDLLVEVCFNRNYPAQDIMVQCTDVGFASNGYGDVANWNQAIQDGCIMPYLAASTIRPNLQLMLVPTFVLVDTLLQEGYRNAAAIADLTGDGYPEAIVGNFGGGLNFYKGKLWKNDIGIGENDFVDKQNPLLVYPNPASQEAHVVLPQSFNFKNGTLTVFTLTGQKVIVRDAYETLITIPLNDISPGVYVVVAHDGQTTYHAKLVVR